MATAPAVTKNLAASDEPEDDADDAADDAAVAAAAAALTDPDAGKTEAEIRAEVVRIRAALKLSNDNGLKARNRRKAAETRATALEAAKGKPADDDVEARIAAAKTEATSAARQGADQRIMRSEAKAALIGKGAAPERVAKLLALVDYSDLEVDDDGEVDGLDGAIDDVVSDWPELFGKGGGRRRVSGNDDDGKESAKPLTATQRQANQLLGK